MKSKILLLICFCLFFIKNTNAQNVNGVSFAQEGDYLVIYYNLFGNITSATISLYVSTDGGATFQGPLQQVSGDIGRSVTPGYNKKIQWDVMNEMSNLSGNIVFDVRAEITGTKPSTVTETKTETKPVTTSEPKTEYKPEPKEEIDNKFLLAFAGNGYAPIGLTMGKLGRVGFYGSIRFDSDLLSGADYYTEGDDASTPWEIDDYDDSYTYTGDYYSGFLNFGGGMTFMVARFLYIYGGFSFTYQAAYYEFEDSYDEISVVKDYSQTAIGFGADIGTIVNFKAFAFGLGLSSIPGSFLSGSFMIGFGL